MALADRLVRAYRSPSGSADDTTLSAASNDLSNAWRGSAAARRP
ncbi:hypothetical protein [Thermocatellispora tengchongensis]